MSLNDILDTYAMKFYLAGFMLENLGHGFLSKTDFELSHQISDSHQSAIAENLTTIQGWCQEIRLHNVSRYIQKCLDVPKEKLTGKEAKRMLDGVKERMEENLGTIRFKFVSPDESPWYSSEKCPLGKKCRISSLRRLMTLKGC